jgi:uncharacterized protein YqfA (UPF0365 family)
MAVALEQEMKATVVEAEAEIPRAIAEAFRSGNIGVMDYYDMKNLISDTQMRDAISKSGKSQGTRSLVSKDNSQTDMDRK